MSSRLHTVSDSPPAGHTRTRRLHHKVKRHYYAYMPNKKHHRVLVWGVFLLMAAVIAGQLLYPYDRALPLARIGNEYVGFEAEPQLAKRLNRSFMSAKLSIVPDKQKSLEYTLAEAGGEPQTDAMISQLRDINFWSRLVPFSMLIHMPHIRELDVLYDEATLRTFTDSLAGTLVIDPVNAGLAIKDGRVVATDDVDGRQVESETIARQITQANVPLFSTVQISPRYINQTAETTSSDFFLIRAQAEAALTRPILLTSFDITITPSIEERASWFEIIQLSDEDGSTSPALTINRTELNDYFKILDKSVGTPSGFTNVRLVDGQPEETRPGTTGQSIDAIELTRTIDAWLIRGQGQSTITIPLRDIAPSIIYDNKYTSSQAGLQAYVTDAAQKQSANIVIQQIDGNKWSAYDSASLSIPSASTYKLYIALDLFDRMNKGTIKWSDSILDTNVDTCFDRMTIASTNPCSVEWINQWGRQSIDDFVYDRGFSQGTDFSGPGATKTTAADLNKFMIGLENSSLISGAQRDRLLHSLSVHPYRYGIPTGSKGQVWDKVGFLWDYIHDTAIVYHPKGKYVMTVMTKGRSYATIAQMTRDIERIMYP